jgi:class 3 adenylate cyclase
MMCDIRDFTTITEKMPPSELVNSLNRYFELMVDVVDDNGGIVDKYIGDAIMALFGAPEKKEDDVWRSVKTAFGMLNALDIFNREQEIKKSKPFHIGIGIHYGVVTAGNIGSDKKMEYTVIGETVNLASRLEGLTKFYGSPLVISETVKRRIENNAETRLLDKVLVKGSDLPMPLYTVSLKLTPEKKAVWDAFSNGQKKFYDRDFPGAHKAFLDAMKAYPNDQPTRIYLERTIEYLKNPPPDDWNGDYRHDNK